MMSRQKLLFAENDRQVMETLGMYLESVECQPVFVGDGREILEKLSGTDGEPEYRAVVLDTRIREMDIHQMIRRIRENSAVPIIILAPESEVADRILALNLGADDYITEPVNPMNSQSASGPVSADLQEASILRVNPPGLRKKRTRLQSAA
jgi:DNA-binding response OmpR family regulator